MGVVLIMLPLGASTKAEMELCTTKGELSFNFTMPTYEIRSLENGEARISFNTDNSSYSEQIGYPRLPVMTYTFALPPGTRLESIAFSGTRSAIEGKYLIEASLPPMSVSASNPLNEELMDLYSRTKASVYSGQEILSPIYGEVHSQAERREYSLVTVTLYPFFYDPVTSCVSFAKDIAVDMHYEPVDEEHAEFISRFLRQGTIYSDIPEHIYNKAQAREWYQPENRLLATPRMLILTTNRLKNSAEAKICWLREWKGNAGFQTTVVTSEDITASTQGQGTEQKIRNWLRANAADYDYLFIIGHDWDIPMKVMTPFNNNCRSESDNKPPSDLYYGDLSLPDNESWNKDGDSYFGEVMSYVGFYDPQDEPDFEMELHVGRINNSDPEEIAAILERIWLFEYTKDDPFKQTSVLAGGILWFPNQNGNGGPGFDASYYMEHLMDNGIIDRSNATTLYEKEGDGISPYTCDADFTRSNLVDALKGNEGIFVENNHGWEDSFFRTVWHDDGDGIPEEGLDIEAKLALNTGDTWKFETADEGSVGFLLSCLNGKPDSKTCLAQSLLDFGSVAVVAHTRSALGKYGWLSAEDGGQNGLYYYVLENYLKKSETYDYVLGDAVDAGRLQYFNQEKSTWQRYINTYEHVIFGDPSLRHYGRNGNLPIGIEEEKLIAATANLQVDLNHKVTFSLPAETSVCLEVWDAVGRKVETLVKGYTAAGTHSLDWDTADLASGSYFMTLKADGFTRTAKAVIVK